MARRSKPADEDPEFLAIQAAFLALFKPVEPKYFSGFAQRYPALSDRGGGVQWSTWYNRVDRVAELAVNLEGMKKEDWPVGRFVLRELADPRLPAIAASTDHNEDLAVYWWRDAWVQYKVPIREASILDSPLWALKADAWRRSLIEAKACLAPDLQGRATQRVTLTRKGPADLEVSPHFQIVTPIWKTMPAGHQARVAGMTAARDRLVALHAFVAERSKPD